MHLQWTSCQKQKPQSFAAIRPGKALSAKAMRMHPAWQSLRSTLEQKQGQAVREPQHRGRLEVQGRPLGGLSLVYVPQNHSSVRQQTVWGPPACGSSERKIC